ncbi:MAG: hypothetical protein JXR68_06755 [Bacteroidales bacterium]|nr:hypothetical protein [Bacteroidales bacterium]
MAFTINRKEQINKSQFERLQIITKAPSKTKAVYKAIDYMLIYFEADQKKIAALEKEISELKEKLKRYKESVETLLKP